MIGPGAILLAGCLAINPSSDRLTAGDLAPAFPGLESIDAAIPLAPAPAPGVPRIFYPPELGRLAERFHLTPPGTAICVERPVAPFDRDQALAAMRTAIPRAEITILDWRRAPVPAGEFFFPADQLRTGQAGQWWNGYVEYGGTHRFPIWARVSVRTRAERVVALRDLPPGQAIPADAIALEARETIPGAEDFAASLGEVAGKSPRALILAGMPVRLRQIGKPFDVVRGDKVQVDAQSGAAHLQFEAQAAGSGSDGDVIPVTNLESHRRFPARVVGKDRVSVDSFGGRRNP